MLFSERNSSYDHAPLDDAYEVEKDARKKKPVACFALHEPHAIKGRRDKQQEDGKEGFCLFAGVTEHLAANGNDGLISRVISCHQPYSALCRSLIFCIFLLTETHTKVPP